MLNHLHLQCAQSIQTVLNVSLSELLCLDCQGMMVFDMAATLGDPYMLVALLTWMMSLLLMVEKDTMPLSSLPSPGPPSLDCCDLVEELEVWTLVIMCE
jgi:hypothetical protein